ncbi:unnamed protein product [Penicillium discolor]
MIQTWMISYLEIKKRGPNAADLLLLLARFDNRDIWYELVESGRHSSNVPDWLKTAISSELAFKISVKTLIEFSLLEAKPQTGSYTIHPVVQDWCLHIAKANKNVNPIQLNELAVISVGYTVPSASDNISLWGAFYSLGDLYSHQGKLKEAEEMYQRALKGYEKALGPDHMSTLHTANNFGNLYRD